MLGPLMCGTKRKFEEEGELARPDERQSILNISMCKLRASPTKRVEPSLRRSVLIFNTLRLIELELRQEGVTFNPAAQSNLWQQSDDSIDMLDRPPGAELHSDKSATELLSDKSACPGVDMDNHLSTEFSQLYSSSLSGCREATDNGCHGNMAGESMETSDSYSNKFPDLLLNSDKLTISSFASLLDNANPSQSTPSYTELISSSTSSSTSSTSAATSATSSILSSTSASLSPSSTALTSFASSLSSSGMSLSALTPSLLSTNHQQSPDIFGDIDLSMYDFDLISSSSFAPSMKLAPLSAEELMHSFPVEPSGSRTSASPCYKNELLGDDFDHIMQVLVGI